MRNDFATPIILVIFNRPHLTRKVFEKIREVEPRQLLIIADGARSLEERQKCEEARSIASDITWDCELRTNFSDTNLGCRKRLSSGLSWAFSQVEEAIVLEDDCLPSLSFFHFCQEMLGRYRDDDRIMCITGCNFQEGVKRNSYSYYFSKFNHCWGWASWRRAWQYYDVDMGLWDELKHTSFLHSISNSNREAAYWHQVFDAASRGEIDTWDYAWAFACWAQGGLTVTPNVNLVSNIGFGVNATHTTREARFANMPAEELWEITHPPAIYCDREADTYTFERAFSGDLLKKTTRMQRAYHTYRHFRHQFAKIIRRNVIGS